MRIVFRPLTTWPGALRVARITARWDSTYSATKRLLFDEADHLGAHEVVVHLAVPESRILRSGDDLKANARPEHPGVLVTLNTRSKGQVSLHCDLYETRSWASSQGWHDNLRAIAKSLEAMRALDRWGVTEGRQYAGFRELGSGIAMGSGMTVEDAARFIADHSPAEFEAVLEGGKARDLGYRYAAKKLHPDAGGDAQTFAKLREAYDLLRSQA